MKNSYTNFPRRETVLVIHQDPAVLVLAQGILAQHYRVLLAVDAESAVKLAMLEGVSIDLAVIGRNTPGLRNTRELQRRLTSIRPNLGVLSMVGSSDDDVIKMKVVGIPKAQLNQDFLAQVRWCLDRRSALPSNRVCFDVPAQPRPKVTSVPLVARAGSMLN